MPTLFCAVGARGKPAEVVADEAGKVKEEARKGLVNALPGKEPSSASVAEPASVNVWPTKNVPPAAGEVIVTTGGVFPTKIVSVTADDVAPAVSRRIGVGKCCIDLAPLERHLITVVAQTDH